MMSSIVKKEKKRFISYELGLLTMKAALATRSAEWPIYEKTIAYHKRSIAKEAIRNILKEIEVKYATISKPEEHIKYITEVSDSLTKEIGTYLHNGRFRIGVAQKLINLHLKYLWCAGLIDEPPHCPIDGIIRDKAQIEYDWIINDDIDDYRKAVTKLKKVAKKDKMSLAIWELVNFRRRDNLD